MASKTVNTVFICHICLADFHNRSCLITHLSQSHTENSNKQNDQAIHSPRLNKTDHELLHMLKLHRLNDKCTLRKTPNKNGIHSRTLLTTERKSSLKSLPFAEFMINNEENDNGMNSHNLNIKVSSYHLYKYSRREQKTFYASVKCARLKKNASIRKYRKIPLIFNDKKYRIILPTTINSRQKLNTNSNNSYPLIFDPNFHSLVQISTNKSFENYRPDINMFFHLIHSIASQEFQTIVNSNDNQHHLSYTAYSFLNILRQTMADYTIQLQKTIKRNYFQTFQYNDQNLIAPFKIRRSDQSTNTHNQDNHHQIQTQTSAISPTTTTYNHSLSNEHIEVNQTAMYGLSVLDQQESNDILFSQSNQDEPISFLIPIIDEERTTTPIIFQEEKYTPVETDRTSLPLNRKSIRLPNGSNHINRQASTKKTSKPLNKTGENLILKPTRISTRKCSIKSEPINETIISLETKPIILPSNEISQQWSKNHVFYRCHACSHEEFFLVWSRECISLHVSSKHANMEENFKQHLSKFIDNRGRSLKIYQHFLKWQRPWSEKQIEQLFKLSNKL